jgi:Lysyl oxidase
MRVLGVALTAFTAVATVFAATALARTDGGAAPAGLLPDLRTVVPTHLQLVNQQQRETLRFSNGIANTGPGPWALRPDPFPDDAPPETETIAAVQEFRDSNTYYKCGEQPKQVTDCYNVVSETVTGEFVFHPAHNHWHIGDVALFEVRKGSPTGPVVGGNSIKTTFCLIDWYKLSDNSPGGERTFFDCYASYQGIQSGWVDQYHQATEGQQLDLTGVPNASDYYLVSTANYAATFTESNYTNNSAWVKFTLSADSKGNRKVAVTAHSPCVMGSGLCGERSTNR